MAQPGLGEVDDAGARALVVDGVHLRRLLVAKDDLVARGRLRRVVQRAQHASVRQRPVGVAIAGQLVAEEVETLLTAHGSWQRLDLAQREAATRVYTTTCSRHLSNTFLDGGARAEQTWLSAALDASLAADGAKALRLSADVAALVRAVRQSYGGGGGND